MENLHEQLKAYIPKLERSIQGYMTQTPPSPNSAQGIMAMWECLTMLKAAEAGTCAEFTREQAEQWAQHMRNTDGSEPRRGLALVLVDRREHDVLRLLRRRLPLRRRHAGVLRGARPRFPP